METLMQLWQLIQEILCKASWYTLAIICAYSLHQCIQLYEDYLNITLRSAEMISTIWPMLQQKCSSNLKIYAIAATACVIILAIVTTSGNCEFIGNANFWTLLMVILILMQLYSKCTHKEDTYTHFIRNSGLDCGSFMAYSFFRGYIEIVVTSGDTASSKDLKERIEDYEAANGVHFPLKKLLILQPKSMHMSSKLKSDLLENADNLEEVIINRGGVVNRSYQLSVYKIKGCDWYVNVQSASPLITYYEECKNSKMLDKYKYEIGKSFQKHLKNLIWNNLDCRELVEVIYYDDVDEHGKLVDVGVVLKEFIEKSLRE